MGKGKNGCDQAMPDVLSPERLELDRSAWELRTQVESGDLSVLDRLNQAERRLDGRAFRVPSEELPGLTDELNRAVKRAERMGAEPPLFQLLEHQMIDVTSASSGVRSARQASLVVLIGGEVSPAEGWRYLARLDHGRAGNDFDNTVLSLPGSQGMDLSAFRNAQPRCEHCNLRRNRKSSYLVESPDGKVRQVGSACLSDYIGGATPDQAVRYAESLLDLAKLLSEGEAKLKRMGGWSGSDPSRDGFFDPEQYLSWVAAEVRRNGFVSRSEAFDSGAASSADSARSQLLAALSGSSPPLPDPSDEQLARDTVAWARTRFSTLPRSSLNGFEAKAASILDDPLCSYRSLPVLAALLPAYQRELSRQQRIASSPSRHVGTPGERLQLSLAVKSVGERETDYGLQHIYQLEDSKGNLFTWFSRSSEELQEGESYNLKGTVKRHDDFGGIPRTVLTRCRVER